MTEDGSDAAKDDRDHVALQQMINGRVIAMAMGYAMAKAQHENNEDWSSVLLALSKFHVLQYIAEGVISVIRNGGPDNVSKLATLYEQTAGQTKQ